MCVLSQRVTSFTVRTGAGLCEVCLRGLWGDIPPADSELHLDRPTMADWQQPGLFKHVKVGEPLRESNKACLIAKGKFAKYSFCVRLGELFITINLEVSYHGHDLKLEDGVNSN